VTRSTIVEVAIHLLLTIASGNWRSMNSEIAGKMTSAVSGRDEKTDAVAKELKATITE
jgi:hypothetical protein